MNFEYKGFKYGLSIYKDEIHFYSEKMLRLGKPQKKLNAKTLNDAHKEVKKMIDNKK